MNLTPDTFYSVALKLNGRELMKMCSANNETRRICSSEKFNPIWTEKLLKDFNVKYRGNNAYMEYLQHAYLYKQSYWVATVFNKNDNVIVTSKILRTHSDAAGFLADEAMKFYSRNPERRQLKYLSYIATIGQQGSMEDRWNKYEITESEFETKSEKSENYRNYMSALTYLYSLLSNGSQDEKDLEKFKTEEFETIVAEEDIEDDEYLGNIWERFQEEILPSYEGNANLNIKEIKAAVMKILSMENEEDENEEDENEDENEEDD